MLENYTVCRKEVMHTILKVIFKWSIPKGFPTKFETYILYFAYKECALPGRKVRSEPNRKLELRQ